MSLDTNAILASLFVGSIGFVMMSYGLRMKRIPHVLTGITLLVFPYFAGSAAIILALTPVVLFLMWLMLLRGW